MTRDEVVGVNAALDLYPVGSIVRDRVREMGRVYLSVLDAPERELTPSERATWGTCPVCEVSDAQRCFVSVADNAIYAIDGEYLQSPVHNARLDAAPLRVKLVPVL